MKAVLEAGGSSLQNVVKVISLRAEGRGSVYLTEHQLQCNIYLTDMANYAAMNAVCTWLSTASSMDAQDHVGVHF
jgi:enamine deaminase RidA (YjgF/YER057c/UK114 family)